MKKESAISITGSVAAMCVNGSVTLFESQQEFDGESGTVIPAKSIWLNVSHAKKLRDFLNEQFPVEVSND